MSFPLISSTGYFHFLRLFASSKLVDFAMFLFMVIVSRLDLFLVSLALFFYPSMVLIPRFLQDTRVQWFLLRRRESFIFDLRSTSITGFLKHTYFGDVTLLTSLLLRTSEESDVSSPIPFCTCTLLQHRDILPYHLTNYTPTLLLFVTDSKLCSLCREQEWCFCVTTSPNMQKRVVPFHVRC